jgi:hypothetical protein
MRSLFTNTFTPSMKKTRPVDGESPTFQNFQFKDLLLQESIGIMKIIIDIEKKQRIKRRTGFFRQLKKFDLYGRPANLTIKGEE